MIECSHTNSCGVFFLLSRSTSCQQLLFSNFRIQNAMQLEYQSHTHSSFWYRLWAWWEANQRNERIMCMHTTFGAVNFKQGDSQSSRCVWARDTFQLTMRFGSWYVSAHQTFRLKQRFGSSDISAPKIGTPLRTIRLYKNVILSRNVLSPLKQWSFKQATRALISIFAFSDIGLAGAMGLDGQVCVCAPHVLILKTNSFSHCGLWVGAVGRLFFSH